MSCHAYSRSHKFEFTSMQLCYLDSTWHSSLLALLLTYRLAWHSHRTVVALHKLTWNPTFLTVCFSPTFSLKVNNFIFIIAKFLLGLPTPSKSFETPDWSGFLLLSSTLHLVNSNYILSPLGKLKTQKGIKSPITWTSGRIIIAYIGDADDNMDE